MAPIEQFTILLNEGRTFYQPGDEVIGKVFLRLRGEMAIRRVTVGFHGEGHVRHYKNRTHYRYTQPYFHYSCVVYDCNNESANQPRRGNYQPGEFCFPFAFRLPPVNLPSSYHDTNGSIRYWLDSTIERPMWFNETTAVAILVMETVNVYSPELQLRQSKQDEQTVCCCCVRGGKINITGKINKGGYYPGEVIEAKFYVENLSNREVTYTELILKETLHQQYGEDGDQVTRKTLTIACARSVGVQKGQEESIELRLTIPNSLSPSTTSTESIITVSYSVQMIAHVKGSCVCAAEIEFPIKIGFMPAVSGTVWSTEMLQAIAQVINAQLEEDRQTAREAQEVREEDRVGYDDRATLLQPPTSV